MKVSLHPAAENDIEEAAGSMHQPGMSSLNLHITLLTALAATWSAKVYWNVTPATATSPRKLWIHRMTIHRITCWVTPLATESL
jgi:hypothetical protein